MAGADSLVFAESVDTESSEPLFSDKQWLYVNDSNNGSYQGQIVIDTTSLSNSGQYMGWNEAFLSIPLILQMENATQFALDTPLDYVLGLKNGFWQILHSMSVEFNNTSVIQTSNFLNVFSTFKCLTSWSDADIKNWGAVTGFCPDTASSWLYNSAANAATNFLSQNGVGVCNNRNGFYTAQILQTGTVLGCSTPATISSSSKLQCVNLGLLQRQRWLNFGIKVDTPATYQALSITGDAQTRKGVLLASSTSTAGALAASGLNQVFMAYTRETATTRAIVMNAIIRLKDVADFFAKTPLLKGSTMRLYLNTNQTYFTANLYGAAVTNAGAITPGSLGLLTQPVILGGGATNPIMLASADFGQGLCPAIVNPVATTAIATVGLSVVKVGLSIVKTQFSDLTLQITDPTYTSVRLYCPAYSMTPQAEARYLAMSPTKKIVYNDFFSYSITGQAGSFNVLVSNGLPNLRSVLVVPTVEKSSNGTVGVGNYLTVTSSSIQSPFSSCGGTPDPIAITQFQVQLSGKNAFNANQVYDFEQFYEQLAMSNQLNGSLTTGIGSGQIGFNEFEQLYRYYYVNASRGMPQDMGVAKSVQIQGTIQSAATCTLLVFLEFERSITVSVSSGQIVMV
jgi:hypothetical protein